MRTLTLDQLPKPLPPRLWCDFNGADADGRYWVLGLADLAAGCAFVGAHVLLWDWEEEPILVLAQVATLDCINGHWCARPLIDGFYSGPLLW